MFDSELWSLTKTDIACLERCQNWFIRKVFHLPKFSSHLLLLKISGLISVENEIAKRKLFFFARMALSTSDTVLCKLFQARVGNFLTIQNNSFGFIKDVVFFMHKYSLPVTDLTTGLKTEYFLHILIGRELLNLALRPIKIMHGQCMPPCIKI